MPVPQEAAQHKPAPSAQAVNASWHVWRILEARPRHYDSGHLGMQTKSQEPLPHRTQLTNHVPLPGASREGPHLAMRAQRQLIKPKHFWEARLTLDSPGRPPLPQRTLTAAPRAAHCGHPVNSARGSRHSASCPRQAWPCWQSGTCLHVASPARKLTLQLHS